MKNYSYCSGMIQQMGCEVRAIMMCGLAMVLMTGGVETRAEGRIGMDAPPLTVSKWIKGEPVTFSEKNDTVYVVEFWATWCGPCRTTIPHLTKLQKKFADRKVKIIGISDESASDVEAFVRKKGKEMDYHVAVDTEGGLHRKYMHAFGATGIPHAFVVNQNHQIVWEGHPMSDLEDILEKVVSGKFDVKRAIAHKDAELRISKNLESINKYLYKVAQGKEDEKSRKSIELVIEEAKDNPSILNQLAWIILTHPQIRDRNYELALKAARAAHKASFEKNGNVADTLALALYKNGKKEEAIRMQEKAIELVKGDQEKSRVFKKSLETYKAGK